MKDSSALLRAESVCVKTEPREDVYIKDRTPAESVSDKAEPSYSLDVSVKVEPLSDDECVKDESVGVSAAAAAAELYADHVVKDELVLGPEVVERRAPAASTRAREVNQSLNRTVPGQQPVLRECCVRLERIVVDELLTASQGPEKSREREVKGTEDRALENTKVRIIKENNGGQIIQEEPSGRAKTYRCALQHIRIHTGDKPYKCDQCSFASAQKGSVLRHISIHTGDKPYKCDQCSFASAQKGNVLRHIRIHTGDKPYKCDWCSFASAYERSLLHHIRRHTGDKPYKCDQCSFSSAQKGDLLKHIKRHTCDKPYKCNQCIFASNHKRSLLQHIRIHTGDKPYKCDQCSFASVQKGDLLRHIKRHTSDKPYKCNQCIFASNHKRSLLQHIRIHTGDKPYKCNQCSFSSAQKRDLLKHIKRHTSDKP